MSSANKTQIILADAHYLTLEALQSLLGQTDGYTVNGIAKSLAEIDSCMENAGNGLLIIDPANMQTDGDTIRRIRQQFPYFSWLILTDMLTKTEFADLIKSGIRNIVYKNAEKEELLTAIDAALKGKKHFSDEVLELALESTGKKSTPEATPALTTSEIDVVRMIASGLTTKEIAFKKNISPHTVNTHRKNIFRKMGVSNSSELILNAIKAGWIDNIEYFI